MLVPFTSHEVRQHSGGGGVGVGGEGGRGGARGAVTPNYFNSTLQYISNDVSGDGLPPSLKYVLLVVRTLVWWSGELQSCLVQHLTSSVWAKGAVALRFRTVLRRTVHKLHYSVSWCNQQPIKMMWVIDALSYVGPSSILVQRCDVARSIITYRMSCMRPLVCRPGDHGRVCCRTTTSSSISRCTCARSCLRCAAATTSPSDPTTSPSRSVLHLTTGIRPGHHLRWDTRGPSAPSWGRPASPRSERAATCRYMLLTFTLSNLFCTNVLHQHVHYT